MYALLASYIARQTYITEAVHAFQQGRSLAPYMAKAIPALRDHLGKITHVDQQLTFDVFALYTAEHRSKNYDSAAQLLRLLKSMLESIGAISKVSYYLQRAVFWAEVIAAFEKDNPPVHFSPATTIPYDLPLRAVEASFSTDLNLQQLSTAFHRYQDMKDRELLGIVNELRHFTLALESNAAGAMAIDRNHITENGSSLNLRLLFLPVSSQKASLDHSRQESCRQALQLSIYKVLLRFDGEGKRRSHVQP